jgi:hypothetical protein
VGLTRSSNSRHSSSPRSNSNSSSNKRFRCNYRRLVGDVVGLR